VSGPASGGRLTLLERAEAMSTVRELVADVQASSEGRLLFVGGEAGVGKTAFLREFCRAQPPRTRILWGACQPLRTPRPLGPLQDVAEVTGGELQDLVARAARPHEVAAALMRALRRATPTVLVLEDVHWADEATLDVLTLLTAKIASAPALLLASYRDDELDRVAQLRLILGEFVGRQGRLKLQPLSVAGVTELAEGHEVDGPELYRRTAGNPFFVTEILAAGGDQIPETVRDAVLARAGRLSQPARRLLEAVAVVPGHVDLWLLEALAGELIEQLDECVASGVLTAGQAHVTFRHDLARLAIEEALPPNRRVALHRAALAASEAREGEAGDFARLADHAEGAADREAVLRWAPPAAERAGRSGSHREAAAQYRRALRFADDLAPERRGELLQRRVDECWIADQFDAAIEAQEQALECWRRLGDRGAEGDALRTLSRLLFFVGRVADGEALAVQAIALLEQLPPGHELAMAYGNISQRRMVLQDFDGALRWGRRALELARSLNDTEAAIYALTNIGGAEFQVGSAEGLARLEQGLALARQHGFEDFAGRAFLTIVHGGVRQRDFGVVDAYLEPGLQFCRERGLDTWRLYLLACRALLELHRGRWDRAADAAGLVLRDPRGAPLPRSYALTTLGLLRARRGDPEPHAPLKQADALVRATEEVDRIGQVAAAKAEVAWLAGDHAAVKRATDEALSRALDRGVAWLVGELVCWRWRSGVNETLPSGALAEPYALSIAGDWSAAARLWHRTGCPYEAALALSDSDDEVALRRAVEELQALGAQPAAAIVIRRLRNRGVRGLPRGPRPQTRENPAGLTQRELDVLGLLAQGLRNAQIADRLVVSQKTVEHHVSAILRKLGVSTRGEAGAEAARLMLISRT
jgi:ATP/maltotriose-dependent transcriptional regulator MalT